MANREQELDRITPEELWDRHLAGDSAGASQHSQEIIDQLPIHAFQNMRVAKRHGEVARIGQQTSMAVVKRAEQWQDAKPYLVQAARMVHQHYPIGDTPQEARLRGRFWDRVYDKESAQRITARDMITMYMVLDQLVDTSNLSGLSVGLRFALSDENPSLTGEPKLPERFDLIRTIEQGGNYPSSRAAYIEFIDQFGFDSEVESIDQIITVSTIALGQAVDQADWRTVAICLNTLRIAYWRQPQRGRFILSELKKNISQNKKNAVLLNKLREWSPQAQEDLEVLEVIANLEQMVFFGLGKERVARLDQQS